MVTVSCKNCGKKLCEADIEKGAVSIKCKCGTINEFSVRPDAPPSGFLVRILQPERKREGSPES